jgi:hypothetical protein
MDHFIINARPQPYDINPYVITVNQNVSSLNPKYLTIKGRSFFNISNIYFSKINSGIIPTDVFNTNLTFFNPFSSFSKLSAHNSSFYGIEIFDYVIINNKQIIISLPDIFYKDGYFDIIIQNEAGLGLLTENSKVPFVKTFEGQNELPKPCTVGVQVQIIS